MHMYQSPFTSLLFPTLIMLLDVCNGSSSTGVPFGNTLGVDKVHEYLNPRIPTQKPGED